MLVIKYTIYNYLKVQYAFIKVIFKNDALGENDVAV
jgi:hypothetical protein